MAGLPRGIKMGPLTSPLRAISMIDPLVSIKTLSHVVAFGHFILEQVEFSLILLEIKTPLFFSVLREGRVTR